MCLLFKLADVGRAEETGLPRARQAFERAIKIGAVMSSRAFSVISLKSKE